MTFDVLADLLMRVRLLVLEHSLERLPVGVEPALLQVPAVDVVERLPGLIHRVHVDYVARELMERDVNLDVQPVAVRARLRVQAGRVHGQRALHDGRAMVEVLVHEQDEAQERACARDDPAGHGRALSKVLDDFAAAVHVHSSQRLRDSRSLPAGVVARRGGDVASPHGE